MVIERAESTHSCDLVILGAGYAGLLAALRLRRRHLALRVIMVNATDRFVERVRLQESVAAKIEPRIPSIAAFVKGRNVEFIAGQVIGLDPARKVVRIESDGARHQIAFGQAIYALGSHVDLGEVQGAAEHAFRLEPGDAPRGAAALRARLAASESNAVKVAVVGGAESAIEAAAEIKTARPDAEVTLISRSRIGSFKGPRVERALRDAVERLGIAMIDGERVISVGPTEISTASGRIVPCDICVFAGGLRSGPLAAEAGIVTDQQDRILVGPDLRSRSHPHILAVGDAAHPVAPTGAPYRLSAFAALVSGAYAADMILAKAKGRELPPFSFSTFGQGIAVGRNGVGFATYPDDRHSFFLFEGRTAIHIRNGFVGLLIVILKAERRFPGFFFWLGRRRVSWQLAQTAMQEARAT